MEGDLHKILLSEESQVPKNIYSMPTLVQKGDDSMYFYLYASIFANKHRINE